MSISSNVECSSGVEQLTSKLDGYLWMNASNPTAEGFTQSVYLRCLALRHSCAAVLYFLCTRGSPVICLVNSHQIALCSRGGEHLQLKGSNQSFETQLVVNR